MLRTFACLAALLIAQFAYSKEISVKKSPKGAVVQIGQEPFCEYLTESGWQPAIWPIVGPTGNSMTRAHPIGPLGQHERDDHPHHRSLWFTHGEVNGFDFWANHDKTSDADETENRIVHREFSSIETRDGVGVIVALNDWIAKSGEKVCEDQRVIRFGVDGDPQDDDHVRWIDFKVTVTASSGDVTFGDTKEGSFGTRVAGTMKIDEKLGGHVVNSAGQRDDDAWGQPAEWVDYYGPVDEETVGIAIFSYPSNFRHPCRWHVRSYGLFAANPFGMHHFPKGEQKQGAVTINDGESLTLQYRVLLHKGDAKQARIAKRYREFVRVDAEPLESSSQGPFSSRLFDSSPKISVELSTTKPVPTFSN